jgi:hypothetical protein
LKYPSLSHHFDDDPLPTLSVEFRVIDLLPWPEVELPLRDGGKDLMMRYQALQVSITVRFARPMMPIIGIEGCELLKPFVDVVDQPLLGVIYVHPRRDVHRRDENHPLLDTAASDDSTDLICDVDVLPMLLRVEREIFCVRFH